MTLPAEAVPYAEVIGDPIKHSRSPDIHGLWLSLTGIAAEYRAHHVLADDLAAYFEARRDDPAWRGCNITLPHKIAALDHVADPGGVRASIGAINTVARDEAGVAFGTNTDVGGFALPLLERSLPGGHAIVAGTGGAAHAILYALARMELGRVTLLARRPLAGMALLHRFGLKGEVLAFDAPLPPADLLVNASPLGMTGQPPLDLDLSGLPDDSLVYDIVYAPLETALLKAARARDLDTVDGYDMLIGQAALAFELFFGTAVPTEGLSAAREMLVG